MLRAIIVATSLMLGINFAHACSKQRWNQLYMEANQARHEVHEIETDQTRDTVGYKHAVEDFEDKAEELRMCGAERTAGNIN
jgi:hypothetical protein